MVYSSIVPVWRRYNGVLLKFIIFHISYVFLVKFIYDSYKIPAFQRAGTQGVVDEGFRQSSNVGSTPKVWLTLK
jgi:hypothetical protein